MAEDLSEKINDENRLIPKYHLIKMAVLNQIESHELRPGGRIPSEKQLMEQYSASRITVRHAIDLLVSEGYVQKVQGKGTFIKEREEPASSGASSCSEIIRKQKHTPTRLLLKKELEPCKEETARLLKCNPHSPILRFERIYCASGIPVIYADSKICLEQVPGFEKYDLVNYSMMNIFHEDYQFEFQKSGCSLRAITADAYLAELLHVEEGFPLLYYSGVTDGVKNGGSMPLEQFTLCYRTDVIHFLPEML